MKVLEEFNKDLTSITEEKEPTMRGAAFQLFGSAITKQAADHLEQVEKPKAKGKRKKVFSRPPLQRKARWQGEQTLQLCREWAPPVVQGNIGNNSKEVEMTITYKAEDSSRHVF